MPGTQHEAIPEHRSTWNLARFARPTRSLPPRSQWRAKWQRSRAAAAVAIRPQTVPSPLSLVRS